MIGSLLGGLVKWWRRDRRRTAMAAAPRLEALEDRWLPTGVPFFPQPPGVHPLLALANVATVAQPRTNAQIVFLGDSITWSLVYGAGGPVWSAINAGGNVANFGVNGQTTQGLLYQLSLGQLNGLHPSVIVLTIGTNDLLEGASPQATAGNILTDVSVIHRYQPQAQILVLGAPPGHFSANDPYRQKVVQTDGLVSQDLAGNPWATFVNIAPALESPGGSISKFILSDSIHPTTLGYFEISKALFTPIHQALLREVPHPSPPAFVREVPHLPRL